MISTTCDAGTTKAQDVDGTAKGGEAATALNARITTIEGLAV